MLRLSCERDAVGAAEGWGERLPVDRRAFLLQLVDRLVVERERDRDLARGDQLGHQRMAAAHLRRHRREFLEIGEALLFAHGFRHRREPGDVGRLDAELAAPFRGEQVCVARGQVLAFHQPGVVAHDGKEQVVGRVVAVLRKGLRRNVGEGRAVELLQQPLLVQDLEARPAALEGIGRELAGARLGERALHQLLVDRAPHVHLDGVFLLERGEQRRRILQRHGGVQDERAFFPRLRNQALGAIRALVEIDVAVRRLARARGEEQREREATEWEQQRAAGRRHRRGAPNHAPGAGGARRRRAGSPARPRGSPCRGPRAWPRRGRCE